MVSASMRSRVVRSRSARSGTSMRDAALMRGAIENPMSSSVRFSRGIRKRLHNAMMPGRGDLRSTLRPQNASTRFSPTSGTMSATVAIATRSKSHFSHPVGIATNVASPRFFPSSIIACTSLKATAAPHKSGKGYGARLGLRIANACGSDDACPTAGGIS